MLEKAAKWRGMLSSSPVPPQPPPSSRACHLTSHRNVEKVKQSPPPALLSALISDISHLLCLLRVSSEAVALTERERGVGQGQGQEQGESCHVDTADDYEVI